MTDGPPRATPFCPLPAAGAMPLVELPAGTWGQIAGICGDDADCQRLVELGFTPGEWVRIVAEAPLGGAFAVNLRGTVFALRDAEAACIRIGEAGA